MLHAEEPMRHPVVVAAGVNSICCNAPMADGTQAGGRWCKGMWQMAQGLVADGPRAGGQVKQGLVV